MNQLFKWYLFLFIDFFEQIEKIFLTNRKIFIHDPVRRSFEYIWRQISHKFNDGLLIGIAIGSIIESLDNVPEFIIIFEMVDIFIDVRGMHVVVVDIEQLVLFASWFLAVDDDIGAHMAAHLPDLLHLLFVFTI